MKIDGNVRHGDTNKLISFVSLLWLGCQNRGIHGDGVQTEAGKNDLFSRWYCIQGLFNGVDKISYAYTYYQYKYDEFFYCFIKYLLNNACLDNKKYMSILR